MVRPKYEKHYGKNKTIQEYDERHPRVKSK